MKQSNLEHFLSVLREHGPMTTSQMEEKMFLKRSAVRARVGAARELGLIHICGYTQLGSRKPYTKQIWAIGNEPDAVSDARSYRDAIAERKRIAEQLEKARREIRPFRDPFIAQFFGNAP